MIVRDKLLIFYDYFYPAYKAGGPIQSLTNLAVTLEKSYSIAVITSAYDLNSNTILQDIRTDEWTTIFLPGGNYPIKVWYGRTKILNAKRLKQLLHQVNPALIYLNGIFSYRYLILPLIVIKRLSHKPKVTICPRGMLQHGALANKSFKKKLYLNLLSFSGLLNASNLRKINKINPINPTSKGLDTLKWHATNQEEKDDILKLFGKSQQVYVAGNIPKPPLTSIEYPAKTIKQLRLVYLSLIAKKKNLLLLLEILKNCRGITLDIYGPLKDVAYWQQCKKVIHQTADKFTYKGEIIPEKVQETFEKYDASILLTKGENFGHALYESLSAGRPIITSHFTPWINLQQQKAGWNIDISSLDESASLLQHLCNMPSGAFIEYCNGAHEAAKKYYFQLNSVDEYKQLFS